MSEWGMVQKDFNYHSTTVRFVLLPKGILRFRVSFLQVTLVTSIQYLTLCFNCWLGHKDERKISDS